MMKKLREIYSSIPAFLKTKYAVTIYLFLTWMLFFDTHNIISRVESYLSLREARTKKEYYKEEITQAKNDMNDLISNKETLEKFAREKYFMKKADEDIFIIVEQ